jgi:Zn-dependent metalloprotease
MQVQGATVSRSELHERIGSCSYPTVSNSDAGTKASAIQSGLNSSMSIVNITSSYTIGAYSIFNYGHYYGPQIVVDGSVLHVSFFYATNNIDISSVTDNQLLYPPDNITTTTTVSTSTLVGKVLTYLSCVSPGCTAISSSYIKIVYQKGSTWKVGFKVTVVTSKSPITPWIARIDGNTGVIDSVLSNLRTVNTPSTGLGLFNSSILSFNSNAYGHVYYLEDTTRHHTVLDCQLTNCTPTLYRISNGNTFFNVTKSAVSVQWAVSRVYDYFSQVWNRTGMDGLNGPNDILSVDGTTELTSHMINFGYNTTTSAWTPNGTYYGGGDGVNFGPIVSLDAVGHEYFHGIIAGIIPGGFTYSGESCALEEAYCDIFGAVVERWVNGETNKTWMVGEDYYTPSIPGDALRYLSNPRANPDVYGIGMTYPDSYTNFYNGTADNGGCHINSGIISKAFYLLSDGGVHPNFPNITMTGIGADKAANIYFSSLPLMSTSTNLAAAATFHANTAKSIFGLTSNELMAVLTSWALCGVGSLPSANNTNYIGNSGFETNQYPWTTLGTNGVAWIKCCAGLNRGGYALLGQNNSASASIYQVIPGFASTVVSAQFSFYVKSLSNDMASGTGDTLIVSVKNATSASLFANIVSYTSNTNVFGAYTLIGPFDLRPYGGLGSLRIEFAVSNDAIAPPTTWYIDQVFANVTTY